MIEPGLASIYWQLVSVRMAWLEDAMQPLIVLITVTLVLRGAGAVGLLVPRTVAWAAAGLSALLVVIFPANIYAAVSGATPEGVQTMPLLSRTLVQIVFLVATEHERSDDFAEARPFISAIHRRCEC
jgi:uncharacterized membrane protein